MSPIEWLRPDLIIKCDQSNGFVLLQPDDADPEREGCAD